jgi:hypothetical protein
MLDIDGITRRLEALNRHAQAILELRCDDPALYLPTGTSHYCMCRTGHEASYEGHIGALGYSSGRLTFRLPSADDSNHIKLALQGHEAEMLHLLDEIEILLRAHPAFDHETFLFEVLIVQATKAGPRLSLSIDGLSCSKSPMSLHNIAGRLNEISYRLSRFPRASTWQRYAVTEAAHIIDAPCPASAYLKWAAFSNTEAFRPGHFDLMKKIGHMPLVRQCLPIEHLAEDITALFPLDPALS